MKRLAGGLMFVLILAWTAPAPAQWFFSKKTKINPSQRVPELILTVKTDPDERKRANAAEELRDYDTAKFGEIVAVLADVLLHDKKANVRSEALVSLARIRPASTLAGQALEKAAADDESFKVRWQAKTALPKYHLAILTSRKSEPATATKQTDEPPLGATAPSKAKSVAPLPTFRLMPTGPSVPRPLPPGVAPPKNTNTPPIQGPALFPQ